MIKEHGGTPVAYMKEDKSTESVNSWRPLILYVNQMVVGNRVWRTPALPDRLIEYTGL